MRTVWKRYRHSPGTRSRRSGSEESRRMTRREALPCQSRSPDADAAADIMMPAGPRGGPVPPYAGPQLPMPVPVPDRTASGMA